MDNRHKGIPDNPDIMWITPGTYTGRKQHPHPSQQTRTRCYGGYRDYGGYQGYGDYRGHPVTGYLDTRGTGNHRGTVDTVGTGNYLMPRVTKLPRLHSYRGYPVTGITGIPRVPGSHSYRITRVPGINGVRSTGYSHPTSGRTYVNYGSEYVHPEVSVGYPGKRTLSGTHRTFVRKSCGNTRMNVLRHRMDGADPVRSPADSG